MKFYYPSQVQNLKVVPAGVWVSHVVEAAMTPVLANLGDIPPWHVYELDLPENLLKRGKMYAFGRSDAWWQLLKEGFPTQEIATDEYVAYAVQRRMVGQKIYP